MKWRITEALTFDQMFRLSEPKRVVRSRTVKGPPLEVRAFDDATYHFFNFKSNPSTTGLRHRGYIKFKKPRKDLPLSQVQCEVDCTCPDFRFRWAHVLKQHGASRVGPNSLNQALNRAPRITNPTGRVSLCKHLLALKDYIQGLMYTLPKTGLKSSEDVLSGVVKYAQKRYANHDQQVAAAKARDARFAAARALKRSGRPDPNPDNLPPVPEMEPPGGEPDVKEIIPVEEPVLPKTEQDIEDLEPPKPPIRRPTQRRAVDSLTRIRPMSSKNTPLNQEVATIQELLDDASMGANTPPTEGESAHGQALDLLRSIDQGLRDLNAGIQQIADLEGKENEDEEFDAALPPGQEELDEPPVDDGGGEPGKDDGENLDKELKNLGIPV